MTNEKNLLKIGNIISINKYPNKNFLVINTKMDGGGSGHNDYYPNGHKIILREIKNNKIKKEGFSLYQTGCFQNNVMLGEFQIIGNTNFEIKKKEQYIDGVKTTKTKYKII